jgi:hypothetical protein
MEEETDKTKQVKSPTDEKTMDDKPAGEKKNEQMELANEIVKKLNEYGKKISEAHALASDLKMKTLAAHIAKNDNITLELVLRSLIAKAGELSLENKTQSADYIAGLVQAILNRLPDDFSGKKNIQDTLNTTVRTGEAKKTEQKKSQEEIIQELKEQIELMRVMENKRRFDEREDVLRSAFELFAQISDKTIKSRLKDLLEDARDDLQYAWASDELMKLGRDLFTSKKIRKKLSSSEALTVFFGSEEFKGEMEYMKRKLAGLEPLVDKDKKNPDYLISEADKRRELRQKIGAAVVDIFRRLSEMLFEKAVDIAGKGNRPDALTALRTIEEIFPGYVEYFETFDPDGIRKLVEDISQKIEEERKKINGGSSDIINSEGRAEAVESEEIKQELDGLEILFIQSEKIEEALKKMEIEGDNSWDLFNNFEADVKEEVSAAQQKARDYVGVSDADEKERRKRKIIGRIEAVKNILEEKIGDFKSDARPFSAAYESGFLWTQRFKERLPPIPADEGKMKISKSIVFHFKLLKILEEMEKAVKRA